jgi:uncharacterized DUF497 family protein
VAGRASEIEFEWDDDNISHLGRHRILPTEAEEVFGNDPVIREYDEAGEDRWTALGTTKLLRVLVLIFTVRGTRIRVFTGWDADRKTKKAYFVERGT